MILYESLYQGLFAVASASGRLGTALAARLGDVMELTDAQDTRIARVLSKPRGAVAIPERQVRNALCYLAEHGCKWRSLPERFGPWHTVCMRLNRWAKAGDAPGGRTLLRQPGPESGQPALILDRADEADETRALAQTFGFRAVMPP